MYLSDIVCSYNSTSPHNNNQFPYFGSEILWVSVIFTYKVH